MTTIYDNPTIGLEQIQREAFFVLFENLNDWIERVESAWVEPDQIFADRVGFPYVATTLERVERENFYEGHRPSLIKASIDRYPNVAVMAYRAAPMQGDDLDQATTYRDSFSVELMVKSELDEGEVNRRAQRMADAVNASILSNPTLNGLVTGLEAAPLVQISDVNKRAERTENYGQEFFWQGARLEYAVRKEAAFPSSDQSVFRAAEYSSIDQA